MADTACSVRHFYLVFIVIIEYLKSVINPFKGNLKCGLGCHGRLYARVMKFLANLSMAYQVA